MNQVHILTELDDDRVYFSLNEKVPRDIFIEFKNKLQSLYCSWDKNKFQFFCKINKFIEIKCFLEDEWNVKISTPIQMWVDDNVSKKEYKLFRRAFKSDLINPKIQLYDFQKKDVDFFLQCSRTANFNSAGLGKTIESIAFFSSLYIMKEIEKIFIFVIGTLSYNWYKEIMSYSTLFSADDIFICHNDNKFNIFNQLDKKIFIVPYHLIPDIFCSNCPKVVKGKKYLFSSKERCRCKDFVVNIQDKLNNVPLCLILDESQKVSNPKTVSFKLLNNHKQFFEYRHIMTATPFINGIEKLWSQINLLDESIIDMTYLQFKHYIAKKMGDRFSDTNIIEYDPEHVSKVMDKVSPFFVKKSKQDIPWFKKKKDAYPVYTILDSSMQKLYDLFTALEFSVLKKEKGHIYAQDVINKFPYISQIIDYPPQLENKIVDRELQYLLERFKFEESNKFKLLKDLLNTHIENKEKVLVVDWRPKVLNFLSTYFEKYGTNVLHGEQKALKGMPMNEYRQTIVDEFNDPNSKLQILFLSSLVGGQGLNLNKACKNTIIFSLDFNAEHYVQVVDRIYRINNTEDVTVKILLYDHTLDVHRFNININREKMNLNFHKNKILSELEYNQLFQGIV